MAPSATSPTTTSPTTFAGLQSFTPSALELSDRQLSPSITSTQTIDFSSSYASFSDDDGDDDLSDDAVARLLREAELRMKASAAAKMQQKQDFMTSFPKLNPGEKLPAPPITVAAVATVAKPPPGKAAAGHGTEAEIVPDEPGALPTAARKVKKQKHAPAPTAGSGWYDMPRTDLSDPAVKRDLQLLAARNVLDPHLHYKKGSKALPQFSQVGTVIEGPTEVFSARINRKDRKRTMVEELLADQSRVGRFKGKYQEIMGQKRSGKKEFYKKLKAQRKSGGKP